MSAIAHGLILFAGLLLILAGLGIAIHPRGLGFLVGVRAPAGASHGWTRYQFLGCMLLGASLVMAGSARSADLVPTVTLAMVACLLFALAVTRRGQAGVARPPET